MENNLSNRTRTTAIRAQVVERRVHEKVQYILGAYAVFSHMPPYAIISFYYMFLMEFHSEFMWRYASINKHAEKLII